MHQDGWAEKIMKASKCGAYIPAWFMVAIKNKEEKEVILKRILEDAAKSAKPHLGDMKRFMSEERQTQLAQAYYDIYLSNMSLK